MQTSRLDLKPLRAAAWPDRFPFFWKKIADGRVAITHRGPRDVAVWSRVGGLAGYVASHPGTDSHSQVPWWHAAMTHAVGRMCCVTDADLPVIPFRNRSSFVPLSVVSTLARMDALHPPGPDGSIGANPRSI